MSQCIVKTIFFLNSTLMIVIFHLKSQFITDGTQINFSPQKFRVTTIKYLVFYPVWVGNSDGLGTLGTYPNFDICQKLDIYAS